MPATETGEMLGRKTFRTRPNSLKNVQQPLDPSRESLREIYKISTQDVGKAFGKQLCFERPLHGYEGGGQAQLHQGAFQRDGSTSEMALFLADNFLASLGVATWRSMT